MSWSKGWECQKQQWRGERGREGTVRAGAKV
jgi:hypothetical protein